MTMLLSTQGPFARFGREAIKSGDLLATTGQVSPTTLARLKAARN